jgi:Holliday junction resolvasome RuvABC ATP-dependent DNA helicase subunit
MRYKFNKLPDTFSHMTTYIQPESQQFINFGKMNDAGRRLYSNPRNMRCPLSKFIGNEKAINRLSRAAYEAFGNEKHLISQNFALFGPASTGKTTLVKLFAETVQLPLVTIEPKSVKSTQDIFQKISDVCLNYVFSYQGQSNRTSLELVSQGDGNLIVLPPMIVFIDEVHALSDSIVDGLLKATEPNDGVMDTGKWTVDCRNVCWIIATTDRGLLFDAFDTRFTKIQLECYTSEQVTEMIAIKFMDLDWTIDQSQLVAKFGGRVPREAFAFANEVKIEVDRNGGDFEKAVKAVADDNNIDSFGMTIQRVNILKALGQRGPIAKARMNDVAGCKIEELEKFVMPTLLAETADQKPMVQVTSRGYSITAAGIEELVLRGIDHKALEIEV